MGSSRQPMKRYSVTLRGEWVDDCIVAENEDAALEEAMRLAEADDWRCTHSEVKAFDYTVPRGAERYARAAESILFCGRGDDHRYVATAEAGSWWWTDGHAAVRCDGEPPEGVVKVGTTIETVAREDEPRRVATWGAEETFGNVLVCREVSDDRVVIADRFLRLVEESWLAVEWRVASRDDPEPANTPFLAYSGGRLVAVVMGVRDHVAQQRWLDARWPKPSKAAP